jgi:hypothetical protein
MGNHQIEIAQKLKKEGCLEYGTCKDIVRIIEEDNGKRKEFEARDPNKFLNIMRLRFAEN